MYQALFSILKHLLELRNVISTLENLKSETRLGTVNTRFYIVKMFEDLSLLKRLF